ncbi:hypothetical protein F1D05_02660 [Kribbella qitaiheensis]|uniref:Guanylate cyclase domain-containing protein n=1 Tax=Kribbella qitaiheensis TaxID=1544730 RepID=A0A7G6WSP7_9ACTN|nr:hypothetical protein [Kribbella qitaiheensis]QNE17012.1 hypothetical protein F1D05_02660 [Kribbella qitaiheensis]
MGDPVHKTILLLDIQKFGPRLHLEQAEAHRVLYSILRRVLASAGIEQMSVRTEDRGDGVFVLLDAGVPKVRVIRALLTDLPTALYDYNRLASESAQVRMRTVLHAGDVEITSDGAVGPPVVEAFRLINSEVLRKALADAGEPSVLCVSDAIHRDVVRHDHSGIRVDRFHRLVAVSKEGPLPAWVHTAMPAADGQAGNTSSPADQPPAQPSPPASGNFFNGAVTVQGDAVGGNKTVHGGPA